MAEMRNFDKTINEFIMTAEEITQLLIDRDIVFIFNESVPGSEHDETLKLLRKGLERENGEYLVENGSFTVFNDDPGRFLAMTLDMIFGILLEIKNSWYNTGTVIFNGSLLSIFAHMLKDKSLLTRLTEDTQMSSADKRREIKLGLESAWITSNFPAQDYSCIKEYVTDTFMWNEFVSALFMCGNIHVIPYHLDKLDLDKIEEVKYKLPWKYRMLVEDHDDYASTLLSISKVESLLDSVMGDRIKSQRLPQYPEDSLNTYFRTDTSLFLDPTEIKFIVNRDMGII
ncbi:MAG: hypothetical protein J5965_06005 [Aeriscardovia sp.]|nr:hypothetical protein [Aeriscardovia sp.]